MADQPGGLVLSRPVAAAQPATVDDLAIFMRSIEDTLRRACGERSASLDELRKNGFGGILAEFKLHKGRFVLVDFAVRTTHQTD
jgi:hypothetical protein